MILNLTQHAATPDQVAAGVVEPRDKPAVCRLLTFDILPTREAVAATALALAAVVADHDLSGVMVGGAPYLMAPLQRAIEALGRVITVLYAYSQRVISEAVQPDGSVRKTQTFRHAGWVEAL